MKFKELIKGKGLRILFRKNIYTYLVNEFMIRENHKPFQDTIILVHGLIECKKCSNV